MARYVSQALSRGKGTGMHNGFQLLALPGVSTCPHKAGHHPHLCHASILLLSRALMSHVIAGNRIFMPNVITASLSQLLIPMSPHSED